MKLKNVHYVSGIVITVFVGLHLFNHIYSIFGAETHIRIMKMMRLFYRNPVIETLLLGAVMVQIITGLRLFSSSRKLPLVSFEKLQVMTGLYLAFFLIIHVSAVLTGRYYLHLDTNFYFGVAGINTFPLSLFFVPYYALAILSFFGHTAAIHHKKMQRSFAGLTPEQQSKVILLFGFLLTLLILFGLTGRLDGVEIPSEYHVLMGK